MTDERILSREVFNHVGDTVTMRGWAQTIRVHAKVAFVDLRDRTGITQLVFTDDLLEKMKTLTVESVISIKGKVGERPKSLINPNIVSGSVEIQVEDLVIETISKPLPFPLNDETVNEDSRLKYRYLDLRSKRMSENIRMRHKINNFIRSFLDKEDFVEIETPIVSKSTPEGARDYLVPSRIMPGSFYALPQSPQQYKQLLMVAGMERYYQIARCFRDEDARGDRQPEFTQLDIEMSFTSQEEVLGLLGRLVMSVIKEYYPEKILTFNEPHVLTYKEAMDKYGSDKPDLRKDKQNLDELALAFIIDFPLFEWKESEKRFDAMHHPFTSPAPESEDNFEKKPEDALADQWDMVLNGFEIASGSIRIHKSELQARIFKFMGHKSEVIQDKFGHLLEAFSYGVPPHGGIAMGIDRFIAILQKEETIRDVIAFAKSGDGKDLMMNSPCPVDDSQLKDLGISIKK